MRAEPFGRARHSVRAELRPLTIRTSHSARGAQRTARPTFFCDWRFKSVPLRSPHGFARPQKVTSHVAAMKFNSERFVWHCRLCLLMPDHLHAVIAFPREAGMQRTAKNWKKFVAGKHGVDWQRDFFDHSLRNRRELEEKTRAIS